MHSIFNYFNTKAFLKESRIPLYIIWYPGGSLSKREADILDLCGGTIYLFGILIVSGA